MPDRAAPTLRTALVALLLASATFLLFSRSIGYGFADYDDPRYIVQNTAIQGGFTPEALRWAFTGQGDIWNPLVRLSHILDIELFGLEAAGHHLQGILWHAFNAVLAFLLLQRLTGTFWTSALGAALFAWHPLRVESVTWISERKDVVSVAFGLLTLLAYLAYARRRAVGLRAGGWYGMTVLAFAAALLSKPSMVTLPGVFLLLDYWPLARFPFAPVAAGTATTARPGTAALLLEKLPFAALAGLFALITIRTQTAAGDFVLHLPPGARLANAVVALPRYLGNFFWPFDLCIAYPHPGWWPAATVAAAALLVAAVSWFAWRVRRTQPWLVVGWLWFVVALLPMSGLVQVGFQSMADRYTYFPMLGWGLALLWTARHYSAGVLPRWVHGALAALLVLGCGARTWHQQGFWRDPISLNEHAVAATRNNPVAHAFLSFSYASAGRLVDARAQAERSLALDPRNRVAAITLARVESLEGHAETAIRRYRTALDLEPADLATRLEFAHYLLALQRPAEAEELLHAVSPQHPDAPHVQVALSHAALLRGARAEALALLRAANDAHPAHATVLERLAILLQQDGRAEEARPLFTRALALAPRSADLLLAHGSFLFATGQADQALAALDQAVALRPHDAMLRQERAGMLASLGRFEEALAGYDAALARDPRLASAALAAGLLCEKQGAGDRATAYFRRAIVAQPTLVPAHLGLMRLAEAAGRTEETDAVVTHAIASTPQPAELHRSYAEILARRRSFAAAIPHFRRAIELVPTDTAAQVGLGYMLWFTGDRAGALARWEETLRLQPDFPGLREHLASLKRRQP